MDDPGCPRYGNRSSNWSASDHCCYCKNTNAVSTVVSSLDVLHVYL